ncbi:hypothetical protein OG824_31985 [Streptomyces prunicolor]|uniref:hypothetical protein n=1 Tax=Streptomyces prunicolor TaxID=67348 RepID=UPI0022542F27|nr:hypothetical protein [Streptomyces prunicolor]MCX5239832.1 hypothetical protein [Streptomyces prunicolor]
MPAIPYVTAAEFEAHPTYLALGNLRQDNTDPAAQTAELTNILLMASAWADSECNQPLGAHLVTRSQRARVDQEGNLQLVANHFPVLAVVSVAYGSRPNALVDVPDLSGVWMEQNRLVKVPVGLPRSTSGPGYYVRWTFVAGRVATQVNDEADQAASALTVTDPTGVLPGESYRLWEPGVEETVIVADDFVPPTPSTAPDPVTVPLTSPTRYAHSPGFSFAGMTPDVRLAITSYGASLLMRPDTANEDEFPDNNASSTRSKDSRPTGLGLVKEARRILMSETVVS